MKSNIFTGTGGWVVNILRAHYSSDDTTQNIFHKFLEIFKDAVLRSLMPIASSTPTMMLSIDPRTLHLLGKYSVTKPHPQPHDPFLCDFTSIMFSYFAYIGSSLPIFSTYLCPIRILLSGV